MTTSSRCLFHLFGLHSPLLPCGTWEWPIVKQPDAWTQVALTWDGHTATLVRNEARMILGLPFPKPSQRATARCTPDGVQVTFPNGLVARLPLAPEEAKHALADWVTWAQGEPAFTPSGLEQAAASLER